MTGRPNGAGSAGDRFPPPRLVGRVRFGLGRAIRLATVAASGLSRHHGTQLAASMAYYGLFSIFPAAIVVAAVAGLFLDDPTARADALDFLTEELPVSDGEGRGDLEQLIDGVASNSGTLGLIGVIGLLVSSSALMSAIRNSLNIVFGGAATRGALRGKALDLGLILVVGALVAASFAATIISRLDITIGGRVGDAFESFLSATGLFLPIVLTAAVFTLLFTVLPVDRRPLRDLWPGIAFATVGYELLKAGFSVYLDNFANYSAVYGSIGAVIAFMFFAYLAGVVLLLGAEMAAAWPAVRAGEHDPDPDKTDERSLPTKLRELLSGLVTRQSGDPPGAAGKPDGEQEDRADP